MIEPRVYTVSFAATAETGSVDFFELTTTSAGGIALLGLDISQTTDIGDAKEEMIPYTIKRATGTYTTGSGGSSGVARPPVSPGDAGATFTAKTLNTTQLVVGTGALTVLHQSAFNDRAGLQLFWTPETAYKIGISSALVIGMTTAPSRSVTWIGTAYVGEMLP